MSGRQAFHSHSRRRGAGGQVLPIFALIGVVLFAATGLAIDAGMGYLTYNGAERAAAAAALAGVPYMPAGLPTGTNTSTTCAGTAGAAACAATARAGYTNGSTVNGHPVTITVSRYPAGCGAVGNPCADNKLQVQVQAYVQPTFLHVLGFSDHPVVASDTGFFLPPISLGQPGAQLGSTIDQLGTSGSYYFLRSEGYGNDRIEGDAYDPYTTNTSFSCTVGSETTAGLGTSTDVHTLSGTTDVSAAAMSSASASPLPTRGGYNFSIAVPSTIPGGTGQAQIYNPAFAPDGGFNPTGGAYNMHEQDTSFSGNTYTDQYSAMEYTLFKVNDRFDHSTDVPLSQIVVDPLNVTITGGAVSSFVDVRYPSQTLSAGSNAAAFNNVLTKIYHSWVDVGSPNTALTQWISGGTTYNVVHVIKALASPLAGATPAASYRLRVDMLDYNGLRPGDDAGASQCSRAHKGYAAQLATSSGTLCADANCQMSALDELSVYTPVIASAVTPFSIPLFNLPADYAGQTINFYVYDVGDVSGTNSISIINPDTGAVFTTPSGVSVYDLGISRNASLPGNLVQAATNNHGGTADSCASPAIQPNGNIATVNTYPIAGGCAGRNSTFFNGRWLLFQLQIPSTYAGGGGNYWQMQYSLTSGVASDTFTIAVNYANSPVHLL
jgi:hypothetical protein